MNKLVPQEVFSDRFCEQIVDATVLQVDPYRHVSMNGKWRTDVMVPSSECTNTETRVDHRH